MLKTDNVSSSVKNNVQVICQEIADELSYELVEVSWVTETRGLVLTVYIYKTDGISLDNCEKYHKSLQERIENVEYDFLEVSSPGIDRPVKTEKDFKRVAGEMVEVKLFAKLNGKKKYDGKIVNLDENEVTIDANGKLLKFPRKLVAIIKPIIDIDSEIESVDLEI